MREGNYESSEHGSGGVAVTFLLIGLGAGALIALLFAPKSGKHLRRDLRRKYEDARGNFDDWKDEAKERAQDALERGTEIAEEIRERMSPNAKTVKR
jgi:gas vesicle protein